MAPQINVSWHWYNPWKNRLVYVPVSALARTVTRIGEETWTERGSLHICTLEGLISRWKRGYGKKLDAYILPPLPAGNPFPEGGVRYGPEPDQYLALSCYPKKLIELLEMYRADRHAIKPPTSTPEGEPGNETSTTYGDQVGQP